MIRIEDKSKCCGCSAFRFVLSDVLNLLRMNKGSYTQSLTLTILDNYLHYDFQCNRFKNKS